MRFSAIFKISLYRYSRVIEKEKCSGGKRGVPGVPKVLLFNNTNAFNRFYGVPNGVPMVSLRDT